MAKYVDHLGNEFNNRAEMHKHHNIYDQVSNSRQKKGWSLDKILTTPPLKKLKTHKYTIKGA